MGKLTQISTIAAALLVTGTTIGTAQADILDKTKVKVSGYIKADAMFSSYSDGTLGAGSIGRDFYIPSLTPVGGKKENTQYDAHIKQTRFRFNADTTLANGDKISGLLEFDFHATPDGNERISNSYEPRIRHAFIKYKNWLVGQTWSTFQDVGALPETLDFVGVTDGTIFVRQTMVKYSQGGFEVALENPESTITRFGGGGRIVSDDNSLPDLTVRYKFKGDWGHVAVAGLARKLAYVNQQGENNIDASTSSYGVSLTGKIKVGEMDDIRFMFNTGSGLGRYLGLNAANGAVLTANGDLESIDSTGVAVAFRHFWSPQWRSTLTYSAFSADNDTNLTGTGVTKSTQSMRANLLYSPSKELTFGVEYARANREIESGADGDMDRVQVSAKYAF